LIKDAEKFKDQDEKARKKIEAKVTLEGYVNNIRYSLNDEKLDGKIDQSEKTAILNKAS
jgi:L1 cell adhesion molecule like protein